MIALALPIVLVVAAAVDPDHLIVNYFDCGSFVGTILKIGIL